MSKFRRRFRVAGPLALGLVLIALFVFLLFKQSGTTAHAPERAASGLALATPVPQSEIPWGPPGVLQSGKPPPPAAEGLKRWNFDRLPAGWDPEVAGRIARFFEAMDIRGPDDIERLKNLDQVREDLRAYLAGLSPEAIPTLNAILMAEPDFVARRFILYGLGEMGPRSEEATFALKDFYDKSREEVGARSEMNHVIEAMGHLKNDTSFQMMNDYIDESSTSSYDRDKFIKALGEHPRREESISRFVQHMQEDEDINVRNHSAQALGKIKKRQALPDLIAAYERETYWIIRQTILGSIGKTGDPSAIPFLAKEARNAEPSGVRLSAARALWLIGTPTALAMLRSVADEEREPNIRDTILEWLSPPAAGGGL